MRSTSQSVETMAGADSTVPVVTLSLESRMKMRQHGFIELRSDRIDLDLADYLFRKTIGQQAATKFQIQTASLEVEQLFVVDLAHRRSVRALHVIRVDLQLRFGINPRLRRQQQVLVGLHRVGLLRTF